MKLVYIGPSTGGIDIPAAGIRDWKPDEEREVPGGLAKELLDRGEFKLVDVKRKVQESREE